MELETVLVLVTAATVTVWRMLVKAEAVVVVLAATRVTDTAADTVAAVVRVHVAELAMVAVTWAVLVAVVC